ncbi:hypothetical protein I5P86_12280 [Pseudomonas glycinae]|uniref:hypothetical protein n=1 Tax=Pseudomonas TaxID=286 RepID=UPI0018D87964|nr:MULTISPECIES: hypothetical protein [Pseudomonas]MBH3405830.1 hypothetical protein [Pseudomonas glycinae]MDI3401028.1 hypothetical protein [Pseudomonas sp. V88_4]
MKFLPVWIVLLCLVFQPASGADTCQSSLSPASVNLGSATRADLLQRTALDGRGPGFGLRSVHLRVHCPDVRLMRWAFVAPPADPQRFRWAAGTLQLRIVAARVDGAAVHWRLDSGQPVEGDFLRPGIHVVPWRADAGIQGSLLEVELELDARVDDASSRPVDPMRFEGQGAFMVD